MALQRQSMSSGPELMISAITKHRDETVQVEFGRIPLAVRAWQRVKLDPTYDFAALNRTLACIAVR